jgi:1-acyl-sn-glycerol-3-phosphate acyltransferase
VKTLRQTGLIIYSILFWLWFILTNIAMFAIACIIWIITRPAGRKLFLLHQFSSLWGHSYMWLNVFWPTKVIGRQNIKPGKPYVIISNHQSMLDILVLYGLFRHYKWVSKKENFSIPIIGWLMRLNNYVELDRSSKKSYLKTLDHIAQHLRAGNSVMMFPEGTRGPAGQLLPFKEGAFRMAIDNKVGLIPVLLDGTAGTIPKGKIIMSGRTRITVRIYPEIPFEQFREKEPKQLMNEVREWMVNEYNRILQDKD